MNILTNFDPSANTSGTFNLAFPRNRGKVVIWNESKVNLQLTFANNDTEYAPAWQGVLFCVKDLPSPVVTWSQYSVLSSGTGPISQVVVVVYDENETVPGTFPASIVRQTNVGNSIPVATSANSLANDGNTQTVFIESTPSGAASSTISIDNEGNVTIKGNNAGTLTTLLQLIAGASPGVKLAAAAVLTEILGTLQVDGNITDVPQINHSKSANTGTGGYWGKDNAGTAHLLLQLLGADGDVHVLASSNNGNLKFTKSDYSGDTVVINDTTGVTVNSNFKITNGQTNRLGGANICAASHFSGTAGSGGTTFNHNYANGTPNFIAIQCNAGPSTSTGSTGTITSTQVTVYQFSTLTFSGFATSV